MTEVQAQAPPDVMTVVEVAEFLRCSERHVHYLVATEQLPSFKIGDLRRFRRADLEDHIAEKVAG